MPVFVTTSLVAMLSAAVAVLVVFPISVEQLELVALVAAGGTVELDDAASEAVGVVDSAED